MKSDFFIIFSSHTQSMSSRARCTGTINNQWNNIIAVMFCLKTFAIHIPIHQRREWIRPKTSLLLHLHGRIWFLHHRLGWSVPLRGACQWVPSAIKSITSIEANLETLQHFTASGGHRSPQPSSSGSNAFLDFGLVWSNCVMKLLGFWREHGNRGASNGPRVFPFLKLVGFEGV